MTDHSLSHSLPDEGVSRRNLMIGLGAIAGATAALGALPGSPVAAAGAETATTTARSPLPEVLGATKPFLTYLGIDALAFHTDTPDSPTSGRYFENLTGTGALMPNDQLSAPLPLPAGSIIQQINIAYQGQPILQIFRRPLAAPNPIQQPFVLSLQPGAGPKTQTIELATPITVQTDSTYTVQFFTPSGASIYGVTVGYLPPTQSFIPFSGPIPRVLDTREPGGGGKLAPNCGASHCPRIPRRPRRRHQPHSHRHRGRRLRRRESGQHRLSGQLQHQLDHERSEHGQRRHHRDGRRWTDHDSGRGEQHPRRHRPDRLADLSQRAVAGHRHEQRRIVDARAVARWRRRRDLDLESPPVGPANPSRSPRRRVVG